MRCTILTYGTRGDVQPFVALGVGLRQAGHQVRVAAPEAFADFVTEYGLDFAPLAGDPKALIAELVSEAQFNPAKTIQVIFENVLPFALKVLEQARAASADADVVVHSFLMTVAGRMIAQERRIPDFSAQLFPAFTPTTMFPSLMFPNLSLGQRYNLLTHHLFSRIFWYSNRLGYSLLRRRNPDLPPLSVRWSSAMPTLNAISPTVMPPAADWGENVYTTGFWFLNHRDWQPPQGLEDFLAAGDAPVYIGFGSMVTGETEQARMSEIIGAALRLTGLRAILTTGWGSLFDRHSADNIYVIDSVPHDWLFPQMAAVVHHGGAGTTAAALRAGVPSAIMPFVADQLFWARRVYDLGVSPRPILKKHLSPESMSSALHAATIDPYMRRRAAALGKIIGAEQGVERAVQVLEETVKTKA